MKIRANSLLKILLLARREKPGSPDEMLSLFKEIQKLALFLVLSEIASAEKAELIERMAKIDGNSSEAEIEEKLRWLSAQGKSGEMLSLLKERDEQSGS